jgi:hypothetical protein
MGKELICVMSFPFPLRIYVCNFSIIVTCLSNERNSVWHTETYVENWNVDGTNRFLASGEISDVFWKFDGVFTKHKAIKCWKAFICKNLSYYNLKIHSPYSPVEIYLRF